MTLEDELAKGGVVAVDPAVEHHRCRLDGGDVGEVLTRTLLEPADLALVFDLFAKDEEMKKKIAAAYDGISKIGGEVKDIDIHEGIELTIAIVKFLPKFLDIFKKGK